MLTEPTTSPTIGRNFICDGLSLPLFWGVSMSRLRAAYQGPCIQVQRTTDDVLKAIQFSDEDMDSLSLIAHGASTLRTWYDQSVSGNNAIQTSENRQPAFAKESVMNKYFAFGDGANTIMETASTVDLTGITAATVIVAMRQKQLLGVMIEQLVTNGWTIYSYLFFDGLGDPYVPDAIGVQLNGPDGLIQARTPQQIDQEETYCVAAIFEPGAATNDERVRVNLNGTEIDETQTQTTGTVSTATFIDAKIKLFARSISEQLTTSGLHTAMVFKGKLTEAELARVVKSLTSKTVSPTVSDTPAKWDDSRNTFDQSGVASVSPYATASYTTRATRVGVLTEHEYVDDAQKTIGIYIDDEFYDDALCSPDEDSGRTYITLPDGIKKVTVVGGIANKTGGTIQGIYPQSVEFNAPISRVAANNTNRLTVLGDSISVGASASVLQTDPWTIQLRLYNVIPVSMEGYGGRSLYEEAANGSAITASVARLLEHSPTNIWIALGVNDYQNNLWSAADFQTAYSALLVAIHAALPSATIYCQTPILTTVEATANTFTDVPQDYRDAVIAATTGKSYATAVNWAALLLVGDLADSIHPNTSGHTKMFNAAKTVLGI